MVRDVISIIAVFCIIISIDLNRLSKVKNVKRTMFIYFTILIVSFTISLLQAIDKAPPSPDIYIEKAIDSFLSR